MAGIYIHIPFCRQACTYCNFHFTTSLAQKSAMVKSIIKEIKSDPGFIHDKQVETIYFGGGTPSLLSISEMDEILQTLFSTFQVNENAEITLEANPDDITSGMLADWKSTGINRLSLGVQSFVDQELKWMNRRHTAAQSMTSLDLITDSGIPNFSVDLIYGSPLLSDEDLKNNLDIITSKRVPHISCYALTVEPRTALEKMIRQHQTAAPDNEHQSNQFIILMKWLREAGYAHYEISNFALPGLQSKHNSSYWEGKPYYGFGPSAHSYNGKDKRRWNVANNTLYLQSLEKNTVPFTEEVLTPIMQVNECIMISLRTSAGIELNSVAQNFGEKYKNKILLQAERPLANGLMLLKGDMLQLTDEGKLLADGLAADLFFEEEKI